MQFKSKFEAQAFTSSVKKLNPRAENHYSNEEKSGFHTPVEEFVEEVYEEVSQTSMSASLLNTEEKDHKVKRGQAGASEYDELFYSSASVIPNLQNYTSTSNLKNFETLNQN